MTVPVTERFPATGHPIARAALVCVEWFVTVGAVLGGAGMIANNAIGMQQEWLEGSPFASWIVPGVLLLLIVAAPMGTAGYAEVSRLRWAFLASTIAGTAQIGWIIAQWLIFQRFFFLQPIMLACGVLVLALSWSVHRAEPWWPNR